MLKFFHSILFFNRLLFYMLAISDEIIGILNRKSIKIYKKFIVKKLLLVRAFERNQT